jgi:hypothetical protein
MVLYLVHMSLNGLKNSDRNVRTLKMIQAVGRCQLLGIQQELWKPIKWWLETTE